MARKQVIEIVCERCERTEYVDPKSYQERPDLLIRFGDKIGENPPGAGLAPLVHVPEIDVTFEDLCSSCTKTVRNLVEQATKKINWKREKKTEQIES